MVAYNFSPEFADDIAARRKRQTLRTTPRAKVGDPIQLYTGQRTKACRKLVEDDPVCTRTAEVNLYEEGLYFEGYRQTQQAADDYARFDGFKDYADMHAWFLKKYNGLMPRPLYETRWDWPAVSNGYSTEDK